MKKSCVLLLSALALAGAFSCSKEKEEQLNPLFNPETNEVVTSFVFNVAGAGKAETRQSEAVVQETGKPFRGISDAKLFSYAVTGGEGKIVAAEQDANKEFNLAQVASPGSLSANNSRRVLEMALPLKTNQLLFYGKASVGSFTAPDDNPQNINANDVYGHLDAYDVSINSGETDIRLGKRLTDVGRFSTVEKLFSGVLSIIMGTDLSEAGDIVATAAPTGAPAYKFDVPATRFQNISWASYGDYRTSGSPMTLDATLYPLEEKLGNAYYQMITINTDGGELRAASSEALLRTVQDLWTVINEIRCAEPISEEEAVAKYLGNEIFSQIERYFSYTNISSDGGPVTGVDFKSTFISVFRTDLAAGLLPAKYYDGVEETDWPTADEFNAISSLPLNNFPFIFNLPRGATHMAFDSSRKLFYYPSVFNTSDMGSPIAGNAYNAESYFYPAELMYFGNSPIRTSSVDKKVTDYPFTVTNWVADGSWTADWEDNSVVKASTRAVAMKYNINYGTAMLKSQVKYGASKLYDNNKAVQAYRLGVEVDDPLVAGESNKEITVDASSFRLTGIIIGGQSLNVGWDHLPVAGANGFKYGFVYDKAIEDGTIPAYGSVSAPNCTMVFDNFKAASQTAAGIYVPASTQDVVYVALEFQNCTGQDFYGNYNLIRDRGYFYLIAALDPTKATNNTSENPYVFPDTDGYVIPPYAADGTSQNVKRVFIQDFRTTVTFTLGPNSLQSAYLTVPDLRSGSMTLGLSVDLDWEEGLDFDVVLGS